MTTKEKLNELGYRYNEYGDFYTKITHIESKQVFGTYSILRTISFNGKRPDFWVEPFYTISLTNMDTINEFYNVLRNEYYDTKKDFESLKEKTPKEKLDNFVERVLITKDVIYPQELDIYKYLLKDLEELERRRKIENERNGI